MVRDIKVRNGARTLDEELGGILTSRNTSSSF
jgi:hypothetical protein